MRTTWLDGLQSSIDSERNKVEGKGVLPVVDI